MLSQGEYLKNLRLAANLKQKELAILMKTSSDYISMLENNKKRASDKYRIKYFLALNEKGVKVNIKDIFINTLIPFAVTNIDKIT